MEFPTSPEERAALAYDMTDGAVDRLFDGSPDTLWVAVGDRTYEILGSGNENNTLLGSMRDQWELDAGEMIHIYDRAPDTSQADAEFSALREENMQLTDEELGFVISALGNTATPQLIFDTANSPRGIANARRTVDERSLAI